MDENQCKRWIPAFVLNRNAVVLQRLFTPDRRAWPDNENEEQLRANTRKLLGMVEREHVALVVFGHDGKLWRTLKKHLSVTNEGMSRQS